MTSREKNGVIVLILILLIIIAQCSPTNNGYVKKGPSYNDSYDGQIDDLKRDLEKSDYDGIVIYDDNCDTVVDISK